jgi:hypothetical protein
VVVDVTQDFLRTTRRWLHHATELESGLRSSLGDAVFDEQQVGRRDMITAVEKGLIGRALFLARTPD